MKPVFTISLSVDAQGYSADMGLQYAEYRSPAIRDLDSVLNFLSSKARIAVILKELFYEEKVAKSIKKGLATFIRDEAILSRECIVTHFAGSTRKEDGTSFLYEYEHPDGGVDKIFLTIDKMKPCKY
jgi:hypothetical protein